MKKIPVAILGATGTVGQRFVQLLSNHPWFTLQEICASETNVGKTYKEAVHWILPTEIPSEIAGLKLLACNPELSSKIVFSALDSGVAGDIELSFAEKGYVVISNAKNHRMKPDVPLLIPEVNPEHLALLSMQKKHLKGFIVTNPNCTTIGLTIVLKPLQDAFGIKNVVVSTLQALSGGGYPGIPSLDMLDNVIPFIEGEEEKIQQETLKILSVVSGKILKSPKIQICVHCNRVPVRDSHLENVTVSFRKKPKLTEVIRVLKSFLALPQELNLPSAPVLPIIYREEENRPQPFLDRNRDNGMAVVVGRVRKSKVFDIQFSLLIHNSIRGAAGAAILNAELLKAKGYIQA